MHLLLALSAGFPDGERSFMDSVAHFRKQITDPVLRKEVARFLAQEASHAKAHEQLNAWVHAQGCDIHPLSARVKASVDEGRKAPPMAQLALTCALEHFTAIMAELILEEPELLADLDPAMARLWLWHAVEEAEHKAVAFDLYQHVGGTYWQRVFVFAIVTLPFLGAVARGQRQLMSADPTTRGAKGLALRLRTTWELWGNPGWFRRLIPAYVAYYRPSFHPWERESGDLLSRARERLGFDPDGADPEPVPDA